VTEKKSDEAAGLLQEALSIEEQVYGKVHPRVAGTLNELGKIAQQQGKLNEAEADFSRMADIYKSVYAGKHYYIGIAVSNLAGVYIDRKNYGEAERLYREAIAMYKQTLSPEHLNVGIARIRLGHALVLEQRLHDAETESRSGYEILMKQSSAPEHWLQMARGDLIAVYDALKETDKSAKLRAELSHPGDKLAKK
jgi:eukaryotic-like serine/threonine-protein kinase